MTDDKYKQQAARLKKILANNPLTADVFYKFIQGNDAGDEKAAYKFLSIYATSAESTPQFTDAFREHIRQAFEEPAKKTVANYKNAIVPIPPNAKIDPEIADAFGAFQSILYAIYEDIERDPFAWGWAGKNGYTADSIKHNRVMNVLYALVVCGHLDGNSLIVDKKKFKSNYFIRYMDKVDLMLAGLGKMGFDIQDFVVECHDTPSVIPIMYKYFTNRTCLKCHDICTVYTSGCYGKRSITPLTHLSYRWLEDIDTNEAAFLAYMDSASPKLREIQIWLRGEAATCGFFFHGGMDKGCLSYTRGRKQWLWVGRGTCWEYEQGHSYNIAIKTRPFKKYGEELAKKFPAAFNNKCQECRVCRYSSERGGAEQHRCGHGLYFFTEPTLEDVKVILEYWKLEHNIH